MAKVELVKAKAFEIDPTKKYIIVFDQQDVTIKDAVKLRKVMEGWGVKDAVSVMVRDISRVKVVEL